MRSSSTAAAGCVYPVPGSRTWRPVNRRASSGTFRGLATSRKGPMNASTRSAVGTSTGAIAHTDLDLAVRAAWAASCTAVELSALHESERAGLEAYLRCGPVAGFAHVSVHAPVKGQALPEAELAARLDAALALPVVEAPTLRSWSGSVCDTVRPGRSPARAGRGGAGRVRGGGGPGRRRRTCRARCGPWRTGRPRSSPSSRPGRGR